MQDSNNGKLIRKIRIEGTIIALTGLHIGGSNTGVGVGGADNVVIRNALNNEPYIPGSSLKGKMRSLLEKQDRKFKYDPKGGFLTFAPFLNPDDGSLIPHVFGTTPEVMEKSKNANRPPSRLIVRDCVLTRESAKRLEKLKTTDLQYTEMKTEVAIDRITSKAVPRTIERVPAGSQFQMSMILNVFQLGDNETDADDEKKMIEDIFRALRLVQDDYLGGKGTRGSGEVAIHIKGLQYREKRHYETPDGAWENYKNVPIPKELQHEDLVKTSA
jgi:CRISPR-associated protein Csm3